MLSTYSRTPSPCCDDNGARPWTDKGTTFFCMSCGQKFDDTTTIREMMEKAAEQAK